MGEVALLALFFLVPAFFAARLSSKSRRLVVPFGILVALCLLFVLPSGGADSPLNFLAAFAAVGFSVGAGIAEIVRFSRSMAQTHG